MPHKRSMPNQFTLTASATMVFASAVEGEEVKPLLFTINAYNGGPMHIAGFYYPVVIDLAGLRGGRVAVLRDHKHEQIVGQGTVVIGARTVTVKGMVTGDITDPTDPAYGVVLHAKNGFEWSASVGVDVDKADVLEEKQKTKVNGKNVTGPAFIVRAGRLGEVSFVSIGADETANAKIAANAVVKGEHMDFEKWLEGMGLSVDDVSDEQKVKLEAKFDEEQRVAAATSVVPVHANAGLAPVVVDDAATVAEGIPAIDMQRLEAAAEIKRQAAMRKACGDNHPEILAKAIAEGWDLNKTELEVIRADRPTAPATHIADNRVTGQILEAACMVAGKHKNAEKEYTDQVLQAAHTRFRGGISLQELMLEAAWANGYTGRTVRDVRGVLQSAFGQGVNAAFSTVDIAGILGNVAGKYLLEGFYAVENVWREISAVRSVSDFKQITSYRLTGTDQYEKVAPDGEIKHGTLAEESFTNQADTYGLMLAITRQDIINDDLGALTSVPRKLGRGSGLKINDVFWTEFMDNLTFFTAANGSYIEGAGTALGIDGLTAGEVAFMAITDADGKPTGVMPRILLVPPALSAVASQLMKALELRNTTSSTKYPTANPHQDKFEVKVSRYLSNSSYTGYSTTAWYLLADAPAGDIAAIETVFLNGQEAPTIESTDADFDTLGIRMRGYHDFGVSLQDARGGLMSKGAA